MSCGTELVFIVSALSAVLAEGRTEDEITLLAAIFTQIGDTLATIAVNDSLCQNYYENCCNGKSKENNDNNENNEIEDATDFIIEEASPIL